MPDKSVVEAYAADPTNVEAAKAYFAEELKQKGVKLFRVTMKGPPGFTFDLITEGTSEEEVLEWACEELSSMSESDFDKGIKEIP